MASAMRRVVPNRLPSTGITWPLGFSNSSAGPPAFSARASCDRKSRRSRYLISIGDRCGVGAVQRDSGPWNSTPNCEVGKKSDKNDRADPIVLVKGLEAGFSVAPADEAIVMGQGR